MRHEISPKSLRVAGHEVLLDPLGAVFWPAQSMLILADLHFEKGSHYARRGQFLPPYDTAATLSVIEQLVARHRPRIILSLGDAFHDSEAEARMSSADADRLTRLIDGVNWIWVLGNHDPYPPQRFGGIARVTHDEEGMLFVHEPGEVAGWSMAGHLHPCAAVSQNGCRVRRRCFIADEQRLILPSLGAYTGGLNVLDPAFDGLFADERSVYMLGDSRTYRLPLKALRPDGRGQARTLPKAS